MSVYNEKEIYLKKSIDSILHQTLENFEFLIINDGSTSKNCTNILYEYENRDRRIRLVSNEVNLGLVKSLNKGLKLAEGEYIARIDSDDIADMHRIEKQLEFMKRNSDYALCGSWSHVVNESSEIIGEKKFSTSYKKIKKRILFFNFFTHSSLFFKKEVALAIGGYNEKIKKAQDYDFILKLSAHHPVAIIPEFLCFNRFWPESISSKGKKKQEWYGLVARLRAIFIYGHPKTAVWKIIPSVFYFIFIPYPLEKIIFKFLWYK